MELLKQPQYSPVPVGEQVAVIYCGTKGLFKDIPVNRVREFEKIFLEEMRTSKRDILDKLGAGVYDDECTNAIEQVFAHLLASFLEKK